MARTYKHSDHEFAEIIKTSETYSDVIRQLGFASSQGIRRSVQNRVLKLGLNDSHLIRHKWRKGIAREGSNRTVPLEKVLVRDRRCDSHNLKIRLIKHGIFERKCYRCQLTEWQGEPIPLSLEHIDGDSSNNSLENLTVLCENCHALTPTWRGRNKAKSRGSK